MKKPRWGVRAEKRHKIQRAAEDHMAMMEQHEQDEIYRLAQELHLSERTVEKVWETSV